MAEAKPLLCESFKTTPYWWEDVPRPTLPAQPIPPTAEVLIIGSGYTGLGAALQTARGGRQTVVLDAESAGWGCSTRNGGQISTSIKPSFERLSARHGAERALQILREGHEALVWIEGFIGDEGIDCDFRVCGRFHAAHSPAHYRRLAAQLEREPPELATGGWMVPPSQQVTELGTASHFGGVVFPRHASLHPARYHQGLLARALEAGVTVIPHCPATALNRDGTGFRVTTAQGPIAAHDLVIASNGYTSILSPWLRRRVIPIGSYMIATEMLEPALVARLIPRNRVVSDTRKLVYYYRASPDRRRILFGGRVSLNEADPRRSAPRLHAEMARLFPELATTRISHSWVGTVAYTFDTLAHIGKHEGIHYAMGYCGSGVSMASYLGMRLGQQVLGRAEGRTGFDGLGFETRPFYRGDPWFLAPSVAYYRWRDRLSA